MFGKVELLIDFGSKKIIIYKKDAGLVLKEASTILATNVSGKLELVTAGNDVLSMIGKTNNVTHQVVSPIKGGTVDNERACQLMITSFISRIVPPALFRPTISAVVLISCGLSTSEKRAVEEVFTQSGVKNITLVESPLAVAAKVGAASTSFVVDIGGSKTEIAIVNDNAIIAGCTIDIGGDNLSRAITDYVADKHRMVIHYYTTEKVKMSLATMRENDISQLAVTAKSILDNGEPKTIKLNAREIREAITPLVDKIAQVIEDVSMLLPESLADDIVNNGITFCGGSAAMPWLDKYLQSKVHIKFNLDGNPDETAVVKGALLLSDKNLLSKLLNA